MQAMLGKVRLSHLLVCRKVSEGGKLEELGCSTPQQELGLGTGQAGSGQATASDGKSQAGKWAMPCWEGARQLLAHVRSVAESRPGWRAKHTSMLGCSSH